MNVILILGAAVWQDGPSPTLKRRCDHAFGLWQQDKSQVLVPCGGLGQHPPAEAVMMQDMLMDSGVPKAHIIVEDHSTNTFENIRNAHAILTNHAMAQMTIVSDRYHLPRAYLVARYFGYRARLSGPSLQGTHWATQAKHYLRETGAIPLYALKLLRQKLQQTGRG